MSERGRGLRRRARSRRGVRGRGAGQRDVRERAGMTLEVPGPRKSAHSQAVLSFTGMSGIFCSPKKQRGPGMAQSTTPELLSPGMVPAHAPRGGRRHHPGSRRDTEFHTSFPCVTRPREVRRNARLSSSRPAPPEGEKRGAAAAAATGRPHFLRPEVLYAGAVKSACSVRCACGAGGAAMRSSQ